MTDEGRRNGMSYPFNSSEFLSDDLFFKSETSDIDTLNSSKGCPIGSQQCASNDEDASSSYRNHLVLAEVEKQNVSSPRFRSKSVSSKKSPLGTPVKKIVRFADALGLDLEDVHLFNKEDDTPKVPIAAFEYLKFSSNFPVLTPSRYRDRREFVSLFSQPSSDPRYIERVRQQKVCLENTQITGLQVAGIIRVLNLDFRKLVRVRYTTTNWMSKIDIAASYLPSSIKDSFSDRFKFELNTPAIPPNGTLIFAVQYIVKGEEFWDNNYGKNYVLQCRLVKS